jgi:hypothetical protein
LSTTQECTENTPFQPPVRPDMISTRACESAPGSGRLPVEDQSAFRQLVGPPS